MSIIFRSTPVGQEREQERGNGFIRYSTVDHAPNQSPPPHSSGRPYRYRERYAIKTRSRLIQHEKPSIFKQYVWKPPKEKTDSPQEQSASTDTSTDAGPNTSTLPPKKKRKTTPKKPQPAANTMTKAELVKAMQSEHPLRTLDVGTLKANAGRALKNEFGSDADLQLQLRNSVMGCLSTVSRLSAKTKRICQQVVGQYLENLSVDQSDNDDNPLVDQLDEDDRMIIGYLSSPFSVKEIAAAKKGAILAPEDEDDDPDVSIGDCPSVQFFQVLLNAIYHSTKPSGTTKTIKTVRAFLCKVNDYLPPMTDPGKFVSCTIASV